MSKYVQEAKRLRAITEIHYNCAQAVVVPFAEEAGISEAVAMRMAANFGGGMKRASVCGSITGGLMVLGLFGVDDAQTIAEYYGKLKSRHEGFLDCAQLLRINKQKGQDKKPHCDGMVYECVELVEEILRNRKKIGNA
ncbi:MAG: C-GCAxxG-C-C family protein [Eubacteriales bacterium]|nr:C-GCAxxG-C-C family protein [Eubacteriales bacterium]